jgi:hypothetical protein
MALKKDEKVAVAKSADGSKIKCGVIMPISTMGDYTDSHWADVLAIIGAAVEDAGLEANLVSNADEVTVIQKTIVQNLYDNPIVICDVSGKNPNVMFELGLRLAFDKPTIIVKDSATSFSFDTGPVEHLPYPRDLRFARIVEFKGKLTTKIAATLEAAKDPEYSTFLKHFGKFTVAKLDEKEVSGQEYVIEELKGIRQTLAALSLQVQRPWKIPARARTLFFEIDDLDPVAISEVRRAVRGLPGVLHTAVHATGGKTRLLVEAQEDSWRATRESIGRINGEIRLAELSPRTEE